MKNPTKFMKCLFLCLRDLRTYSLSLSQSYKNYNNLDRQPLPSIRRNRGHCHTQIADNCVVPRGRVELPLSCENRILSPARLPVPPSGHTATLHDWCVFSMPPSEGQSGSTLAVATSPTLPLPFSLKAVMVGAPTPSALRVIESRLPTASYWYVATFPCPLITCERRPRSS